MGIRNLLQVDWLISPCEAPRLWRHCRRCESKTPFHSSDKFRTNLQKKRVDVWLIYRCDRCGQTWNCPLVERRPLKDIGPEELRAFAENRVEWVRRHAFDLAHLRRFSERIDVSPEVRIAKSVQMETSGATTALEIRLRLGFDSALRADRFLANELGLSRTTVQCFHGKRILTVTPVRRAVLRQAIRDRQRISIDLRRLSERPELVAAILRGAVSP